jgi:PleD family two-component response regulator
MRKGNLYFWQGLSSILLKKKILLDLERKNKLLEEMSSIDGLTKISNHRTLIEFLKINVDEDIYPYY